MMLVVGVAGYAYTHHKRRTTANAAPERQDPKAARTIDSAPVAPASFRCDGSIHGSQMTSWAEAKFFVKHRPGTKMDGNGDGVPSEQQRCTPIR